MNERPILVTGGAGYIGSHVALALLDAGRAVVVIDDLSVGSRELVPAGAAFVEADVGDRGVVEKVLRQHGCDAVIHLAGSVLVEESTREPLAYYRNNTLASLALVEACAASGVGRFVFSSTASVYGAPTAVPIPEDAPLRPEHPYGSSKLMVERILRDAGRAAGIGCAILRYFNVAGADPAGRSGQRRPEATHLMHVIAEVVSGKRPELNVYGSDYATPDGTCVRDYVHVSDLAAAHVAVLERIAPRTEPLVMNVGDGRGSSVREVVAAAEAVAGRPLPVVEAPRRAGDPPSLVADTRRIRELLGWRPRHGTLEEMLRSAIDWEQGGARTMRNGRQQAGGR
ncbi:MAG: UDP-glucose 4-epimerase GalE [Acetobacterales bacterium]